MNIPFSCPHVISKSVSDRDKAYAAEAFARCLRGIREVTPVSLARSGSLYFFCLDSFDPDPDDSLRADNAEVLRYLLECLIELNIGYLGSKGANRTNLYKSGVRYGRTVVWDTIPALYKRGKGDCKSLTCAEVAQLRFSGKPANPEFRGVRNDQYGMDFHILLRKPNGNKDPSKLLGMLRDENSYFQH